MGRVSSHFLRRSRQVQQPPKLLGFVAMRPATVMYVMGNHWKRECCGKRKSRRRWSKACGVASVRRWQWELRSLVLFEGSAAATFTGEASGRRLGICHESATTLGPLITCSPTHVSWRKEHEPYIPGILLGKTCSNFLQAEFFPIACITCLYAIELAELISWQPETSTQAPSFPYLFFGQSDHYCSFT